MRWALVMMCELAAWRKIIVKPGHRRNPAGDHIAQHVARPHRGQLVDVAYQQQVRAGAQRLEQLVGQDQVEHRGFVHHQQVESSGSSALNLKPSPGENPSRRWIVLAGRPVACERRLAARPVGEARAKRLWAVSQPAISARRRWSCRYLVRRSEC